MNCLLCEVFIQNQSWSKFFTGHSDVICEDCRGRFQRIDSEPSRHYFQDTKYEGALDSLLCKYEYDEQMKDYFHRYKFLGDYALNRVFKEEFPSRMNYVPIPIYTQGNTMRSFSHVEAWLPKDKVHHLLLKTSSIKQSSRGLAERVTSASPFKWAGIDVFPESVLLVDDIYTTGTTMHQAAWELKQHGVKEVHGFCLAETLLRK